jgi:hypothetical protein
VVKFTSSTTIGDTDFDIRENTTIQALNFGVDANAYSFGELAHGLSYVAVSGDSQSSQLVLKNIIGASSSAFLYLDGSIGTQKIQVPSDASVGFDMKLIAVDVVTGTTSYWEIKGAAKNISGTTSEVGSSTYIFIEDSPIILPKLLISSGVIDIIVQNLVMSEVKVTCFVRLTYIIF